MTTNTENLNSMETSGDWEEKCRNELHDKKAISFGLNKNKRKERYERTEERMKLRNSTE